MARNAGRFFSPLPMAKSRLLLILVSVRRARPSLRYCLNARAIVVHVQLRRHTFGQHAGCGNDRACVWSSDDGRSTAPHWAAEVEVFTDDFFEEDAAGSGLVQDLRQGKLRLQNGQLVAVAGPTIRVHEGVRQAG